MKRFVLRYGLISGAIMIGIGTINWFLFAEAIGYKWSEAVGYGSMIVALMCAPLAIKYYRDQLNQGVVTFGEAMKIGSGVTLIASIMMFFHTAIFFTLQKDEFMVWYQESVSPEEWEVAQAQMAQLPPFFQTAWFNGFLLMFTVLIIGLIISLISSLVMKSTPQTTT